MKKAKRVGELQYVTGTTDMKSKILTVDVPLVDLIAREEMIDSKQFTSRLISFDSKLTHEKQEKIEIVKKQMAESAKIATDKNFSLAMTGIDMTELKPGSRLGEFTRNDRTSISSYHDVVFNHKKRREAIDKLVCRLMTLPKEIGIVCTGLSGILVGVPVAEKTERPFAIVRKPMDNCHSTYTVEGDNFENYVIIDDFICSGNTVRRIIDYMPQSQCQGIFLYNNGECCDLDEGTLRHNDEDVPIYRFSS